MRPFAIVAMLGVLLASGGCRDRSDRSALAERPLVLLLSPAHGAHVAPEQRAALGAWLAGRAGRPVEVRVAASPTDAIEAFGNHQADLGLVGVFEYLFAHREFGAEAVLQVVRDGRTEYAADLVVRADAPIQAPAALDGRKVAFVDPYSTSGFLLPARLLADARVKPQIQFAGSHDAALAQLRAGQVDAAATWHGAAAGDARLRVLATTPPIPNEPFAARRDLDPKTRAALAAALADYAATPDGGRVLRAVSAITGVRPVTDAAYQGVADLVHSAGKSVEDLVPGGQALWSRYHSVGLP